APFDPHAISGPSLAGPSGTHLLGTNDAGQDLFSQLIWGARVSAVVAIPAAGLGVLVGLAVGGGAALFGGWLEVVVMRIVDLFLAVPVLPLLILIAALAGPSEGTVTLVIAAIAWPGIARVLRSATLGLVQRGHVHAARGFGAGPAYVLRRHVAPALGPVMSANFVTWAATAVVLQSGLAFLGLGDPTQVSWGGILNRALSHEGVYFSAEWIWWVLPAGFAIILATLGLSFLGLAVEPRSNPRWRRS
ncbi:MAG: ABC transporter permease, partial [Actinomycetota bacterium]|nr:ABC transporter permease [Actinomycetota bacterium]